MIDKKNINIGIIGSDGFIGKKLCQDLEKKGYNIFRYTEKNMDIRNKIVIPDKIDVLYHLAAINKTYLSKNNPAETFRTNVMGTLNVLEASVKAGIKKIIFTSSVFVYKNLQKTKEKDFVGYNGNPYGFEKNICEEYIKIYSELFGIDYVILRLSGVYGPGMYKNPLFDVIQGFVLKEKIKLYVNKNSIYNFIYIDDVSDALIRSLGWHKDIINVNYDKNVKISDIYNFMKKDTGMNLGIKDTGQVIKILGNNSKIKKKGWKIKFQLKSGLQETYKHFLKNNEKQK